jgi:hypothetical protein
MKNHKSEKSVIIAYTLETAIPHNDKLIERIMTDDLTDLQRLAILKILHIQYDMMIDLVFSRIKDPDAKHMANTIISA